MFSVLRTSRSVFRAGAFRSCHYSTTTPTQLPQPKAKRIWESFDKTMYYPAILLILFGSQIINVINSQREVEDMERRYSLKMQKLTELKERVIQGEKDIDVKKELELINKMFQRSQRGAGTRRFDGSKMVERNNNEGIIEDFDDDKLNELFGLTEELKEEFLNEEKKLRKNSLPKSDKGINKELINQHVQNEKDLIKYKLNPELHVIVENPGDYNEAAKSTEVSKFL